MGLRWSCGARSRLHSLVVVAIVVVVVVAVVVVVVVVHSSNSRVIVVVDLQSKVPDNPIEPPAQWAWGSHPNGLGYKVSYFLNFPKRLQNVQKVF